jgi:hypothetical protein
MRLAQTLVLTLFTASLLVTSGFASDFFIDDFTDPVGLSIVGDPVGTVATDYEMFLPNVIGGTRISTLELVSGVDCSINTAFYGLEINTGATSQSRVSFEYGGLTSPLNLALTDLESVIIAGVSELMIVPGYSWKTDATVTLISGIDGSVASASSMQTLSADGDYIFAATDFSGVDLSDVDSIKFSFDACYDLNEGLGADYVIDSFKLATIPEPGTVAMLLAVVLALGCFRRRK